MVFVNDEHWFITQFSLARKKLLPFSLQKLV
jgi:hypothetical protein